MRSLDGKYPGQNYLCHHDARNNRCAIFLAFLQHLLTSPLAVSISSLVPIFDSLTQSEFGLYLQNKFGTAAVAFSLATNAVATCLIGFKTWYARPSFSASQ